MPKGFDTAKYQADFSPTKSGTFVSPHDVVTEFGSVAGEIFQLLPDLFKALTQSQILQVLGQFTADVLKEIVQVVLQALSTGATLVDDFWIQIQKIIRAVIAPFAHLLNPLFGNEEQGNLFAAGTFTDAAAIGGFTGNWAYDGVVGNFTPGSATVTLDGGPNAIRSNVIAVAGAHILDLSGYLLWHNVTATGDAFQLQLATWNGDPANGGTQLSIEEIAKVTNPAVSQSSWAQIEGTYTVPATIAGKPVTHVQGRIYAIGAAGQVWFDDVVLVKTTLLQQFIQSIIDNIVNPLLGLIGIHGHTPDRLNEAVQANVDTITGTASQIIQIEAAFGTGTPDADDFERGSLTGLGPQWTQFSSNPLTDFLATFDRHNVNFTSVGDGEVVAYKNDVASFAETQSVTVIYASAPGVGPWIGTPSEFGYNDLWIRMTGFSSWGGRTGLRARLGADLTVQIHWVQSGVETLLLNSLGQPLGLDGNLPVLKSIPSRGTVAQFAVAPDDPRHYQVIVDDHAIIDDFEAGTVSQYGGIYVRRGIGGKNQKGLLTSTQTMGKLQQWAATG